MPKKEIPKFKVKLEEQLEFTEHPIELSNSDDCGRALRLIGPNWVQKCTFSENTKSIYSLDNVRLSFRFNKNFMDKLTFGLDRKTLFNNGFDITSPSAGKWRFFYCIKNQDGYSVRVGVCFNNPNGKNDAHVGFVEFNPNKCEELGLEVIHKIQDFKGKFELKRFDLAVDFPYNRHNLRLIKDKRRCEFIASNSVTEYLGQRENPGRVKLYDKTAELKKSGVLDMNLLVSRVELTCDGSGDVAKVMANLPCVYNLASFDELEFRGVTKAFCMTLQALVDLGQSPVSYLDLVDKRTRTKIHNALREKSALKFDREAVGKILRRAKGFETGSVLD